MRRSALALTVIAALAACDTDNATAPAVETTPSFARAEQGLLQPGAVYTSSNDPAGNAVLVYSRGADGSLGAPRSYATGGTGTGGGLGNQGAVVLSDNGNHLYVVNAGSDDVSVFAVRNNGLQYLQTVGSGGDQPISIALEGDLLYVLNDGADPNVSGFRVSRRDGTLAPLAGSTRALSAAVPNAAQVGISPDGATLVVSEKATNNLVSWSLDRNGMPSAAATVTASNGQTPFGFAFTGRGTLIVSEAFGGAPDGSALSSYTVRFGSAPSLVSGSVGTTETAACWVVTTKNGRFAYTTNTASGTVSGYTVANDGSISLLDADGITGSTGAGSGPIDAAITRGDRFLYVLESGTETIGMFAIERDGSLRAIGEVVGLPDGANGLAAR